PCATQSEIDEKAAYTLVENGVKLIGEGANMPSSALANDIFLKNGVLFGPAQAVNAGRVAVSTLEMAQNSARVSWSFETVDQKLQTIMKNIYKSCVNEAKYYNSKHSLMIRSNIAGFKRIANAMTLQGVI